MTRKMWAVGYEDSEGGWAAIEAPNELTAIKQFMSDNSIEPEIDEEVAGGIIAVRQAAWDDLDTIAGKDWILAGLGYSCSQCNEPSFGGDWPEDEDGRAFIVDGDVWCLGCARDAGRLPIAGTGEGLGE